MVGMAASPGGGFRRWRRVRAGPGCRTATSPGRPAVPRCAGRAVNRPRLPRRARQPGRRRRVADAVGLDEAGARAVLRMVRGFLEIEHRAKQASLPSSSAHHSSRVLPAMSAASLAAARATGRGPTAAGNPVVDAAAFQQQAVELRLDRADRHIFAVGAGIAAVEVRAAIQHVGLPAVDPVAVAQLAVIGGGQQRGAVADRRVHHLALAAAAGLQQGAQQAEGQHHRAAAHVADQVQRRAGGRSASPMACSAPVRAM